jgi:hypothetical protein
VDSQIRRVRPDTRDPDRWVVKLEGASVNEAIAESPHQDLG